MDALGVDLATEPKATAAFWLRFDGPAVECELVTAKLDDDTLVGLLESADRAAIDSPFGWPEPFVEAITGWRDRGTFPSGPREPLRLRATDLYVKRRVLLTPFAVSADKIGALAMRCALLLTRLSERESTKLDRVDGKVIECYPSAALYTFGFARAEVKGAKTDSNVRRRLLDAIMARARWLDLDDQTKLELIRTSDAFDALVSALVARAAALQLTERPPAELAALASVEGWIHLPKGDALPRLGQPGQDVSPR
jgi:predicted nuclease with RNAse H fold